MMATERVRNWLPFPAHTAGIHAHYTDGGGGGGGGELVQVHIPMIAHSKDLCGGNRNTSVLMIFQP